MTTGGSPFKCHDLTKHCEWLGLHYDARFFSCKCDLVSNYKVISHCQDISVTVNSLGICYHDSNCCGSHSCVPQLCRVISFPF